MIKYTVVWHEAALNQMAQIWIDASNRQQVTHATRVIDSHLRHDAPSKGSPIAEDLRELVVPPLRVLFAISESDRLVKVLHVAQP